MLDPQLSFVAIPRSSVRMFGPFEKLVKPLLDVLDIPSPDFGLENNCTVVPCLTQHLPALLHFFPEAILVKTVTNRAVAQASLRTVSVPGYDYDIKFSLACLITSALRVLPSWSAQAAPPMTDLLRKLIPEDLWLFGEVAAITGAETQRDASEARYITCILRENLELKAQQNEEALVLAAALMERPRGGGRTYAEILFGLDTVREKTLWFKGYVVLFLLPCVFLFFFSSISRIFLLFFLVLFLALFLSLSLVYFLISTLISFSPSHSYSLLVVPLTFPSPI